MIFKPQLLERILAGHKTVTRRPATQGQPCGYRVGKSYGVQPGMARPSVAIVRIVDVNLQGLGAIDDADAVREGFEDARRFLSYWRGLYGDKIEPTLPVWRIEFELQTVAATVCNTCHGTGTIAVKATPADARQLELAP